jgi:hypothetical protein
MNMDSWKGTNGRIERQERTSREHERLEALAEIFRINSALVISPFSIKSFARASVCVRQGLARRNETQQNHWRTPSLFCLGARLAGFLALTAAAHCGYLIAIGVAAA